VGSEILDVATLPTAIRPGAAVLAGGEVQIVSETGASTLAVRPAGIALGLTSPLRVFGGDATGDGRSQPIVVTSDAVYVLP